MYGESEQVSFTEACPGAIRDNDVVEKLDPNFASSFGKSPRELEILRGRARIPRGMIVAEDYSGGLVLCGLPKDFPRVQIGSTQVSQCNDFIANEFPPVIQEESAEALSLQLGHVPKVMVDIFGTAQDSRLTLLKEPSPNLE